MSSLMTEVSDLAKATRRLLLVHVSLYEPLDELLDREIRFDIALLSEILIGYVCRAASPLEIGRPLTLPHLGRLRWPKSSV